MSSEDAMISLDRSLRVLRSAGGGVLKVIHGRGRKNDVSVLKNVLMEWTYKRRGDIHAVIPGPEFSVTDTNTEAMLKQYPSLAVDADLGNANTGVTFIWIVA